jgi:uncharacterized protein YjbI with pentapeptide repeats
MGLLILSIFGGASCRKSSHRNDSTTLGSSKSDTLPFKGFEKLNWISYELPIEANRIFTDPIEMEKFQPAQTQQKVPVIWLKVPGDQNVSLDSDLVWVEKARSRFRPFKAETLMSYWKSGNKKNPMTDLDMEDLDRILLSYGSHKGFPITIKDFLVGRKPNCNYFYEGEGKDFSHKKWHIKTFVRDFWHSNLKNANFKERVFNSSGFVYTDLSGANFEGTEITLTHFIRSDLRGIKVSCDKETIISYSKLIDVNLEGTNLKCVKFIDSELTGSNLRGARLKKSNIDRATLAKMPLNWESLVQELVP